MLRRSWRHFLIVTLATWFGIASAVAMTVGTQMHRGTAASNVVDDVLGVLPICQPGSASAPSERGAPPGHDCLFCSFASALASPPSTASSAFASLAFADVDWSTYLSIVRRGPITGHAPIRGPPTAS